MYNRTNYRIRTIAALERLAHGDLETPNVEMFHPGPYREITIQGDLREWLRRCSAQFNLDTMSVAGFL